MGRQSGGKWRIRGRNELYAFDGVMATWKTTTIVSYGRRRIQGLGCRSINADCPFIQKKSEKNKKGWNGWKKYFNQLLGARSTQKLVKIQNTWPSRFPAIHNTFLCPSAVLLFVAHSCLCTQNFMSAYLLSPWSYIFLDWSNFLGLTNIFILSNVNFSNIFDSVCLAV